MKKVYKIKTLNDSEYCYGFEKQINIGDVNVLKKFKNIRYDGETTVNSDGKNFIVHKITFLNIEKSLEKIFLENIDKCLEKAFLEKENLSISSILLKISEYFKIKTETELSKKLLGDIGEIYFIKILTDNNIDYTKYYQNTKNEVFDFFIHKNKYIDIKTTTVNRKKILLNWKQIKEIKKTNFFVLELEKKSKGLNILELIDSIAVKNTLVNEIYFFWKNISMFNIDIINSWTIDEENINYYFLSKKAYPVINIRNDKNITNGSIEISTAGFEEKNPLEKIIKLFN